MADAGGTAVAKKNTPPQLDKAEVLDLVNDSLGFLDRIFTEQGLGVLEANTDTNGVRDFLGEQWDTSRIGKWLQYTDSLAQHVGALVRAKRALAYHAGHADQNKLLTHVGDYKVVINLDQGVIDLMERTMRGEAASDLIVKSLIRLDAERDEVIITPASGIDQEDLDRLVRPVVQVVKDNYWEDDGLGGEGSDDDDDDDEPGHTDEEITDVVDQCMKHVSNLLEEYGFDQTLWHDPREVDRLKDQLNNRTPEPRFVYEESKRQWDLLKIKFLADQLSSTIIERIDLITWLRGQLDIARTRAKAAKNKSAILEAQLKECNAARSQKGQRTGQTTQQTSKESELAGQVRDLRRELDVEKKKHAETKQKYKAASARAGDENGDASGEEGDENDEPSCQEKLEAVCARLEQERKQSKQVVELQDKTRKRAKQAEEARKKLERSLVKEIQKNAKLEAKLKASGGTTTDNGGDATADAAALAADLAKAKKDKDDLEKRAKKAEAELAKAQNAATTQADSDNIQKLRRERAQFKARSEAAESTLGDSLTKEKNATQAATIAKDKTEKAEKAEKAAKAKAAQDAKALQNCRRALAAAQKKKTGGDNPADDDESDEGGLLSQGTFYLTKPRQTGATNNGPLRVVLKSDLIPVNNGASDGWIKKLADAHADGTAKIVKNANGVSVLKIKARFEPKEDDKQRTEEQDAGDKPGDDGKGSKRKAGKDTEDAGQTGKKQKTGATTRTTKATRGRGGGAAGRGGRGGKGKQKATNTDDEQSDNDDDEGDD
ncbi:hypothetical protein BC567DRAFT_273422 [Phyllosticta citribraziliensis]